MIAKLIFFILLSITIVFLLLTIYLLFRFKIKRNHKKAVYKQLHLLAEERDYLLLNNVTLFLNDNYDEPTLFDHIFFGDKYIYVIQDYDKEGGIFGNIVDRYLLLQKNDKTYKSINPLVECKNKLALLEKKLGVSHNDNIFLAMVIYNNSLLVADNLKVKSNQQCFIPLREVRDTILSAERDEVKPFSHQQTEELLLNIKAASDKIKIQLNKTSKKGGK